MRAVLVCLTLGLSSLSATAGGLGEMTEAERAAFRAEVRQYLVDNPEVIVEAMGVLQNREELAAAERDLALVQQHKDALFNDPSSWVGGNPQGDITIVEFMDYQCSYCRKAHDEVEELVTSDGNIRLVMKEFPILGEESILSARFAIAVLQLHGPGAYEVAHKALINLRGTPNADTLGRLATDLGHDPAALSARMMAPDVTAVIAANHDLGSDMEVTGTPMFVFNGAMVRGYLPLEDMRQIVADQRKG